MMEALMEALMNNGMIQAIIALYAVVVAMVGISSRIDGVNSALRSGAMTIASR